MEGKPNTEIKKGLEEKLEEVESYILSCRNIADGAEEEIKKIEEESKRQIEIIKEEARKAEDSLEKAKIEAYNIKEKLQFKNDYNESLKSVLKNVDGVIRMFSDDSIGLKQRSRSLFTTAGSSYDSKFGNFLEFCKEEGKAEDFDMLSKKREEVRALFKEKFGDEEEELG